MPLLELGITAASMLRLNCDVLLPPDRVVDALVEVLLVDETPEFELEIVELDILGDSTFIISFCLQSGGILETHVSGSIQQSRTRATMLTERGTSETTS